MSGYFERILARVQDAAPVALPRRASMFENVAVGATPWNESETPIDYPAAGPPHAAAESAPAETPGRELWQKHEAASELPPKSRAGSQRIREIVEYRSVAEPSPAPPVARSFPATSPDAREEQGFSTRRPETSPQAAPQVPAAVTKADPASRAFAAQQPLLQAPLNYGSRDSEWDTRIQGLQDSLDALRTLLPTGGKTHDGMARPVSTEEHLPPRRAHPEPHSQDGHRANGLPRRPAQPSGIPAPARDPQPTTVHVSIGRIEVRANPAAPTAATRNPARGRAPKLGLQDYLRGREEAGR